MQPDLISHYARPGLHEQVQRYLFQRHGNVDNLKVQDLYALDVFHLGGSKASEEIVNSLSLRGDEQVLDLGCGMGGLTRLLSLHTTGKIQGVDASPDFIRTGQILNRLVGLENQIQLVEGNISMLPYQEASFNVVLMVHVGMNIQNKSELFNEVYRVLRPGGRFFIYDMMALEPGDPVFPLPWANSREQSFLSSLETYMESAQSAGFKVTGSKLREDIVENWIQKMDQLAGNKNTSKLTAGEIILGERAREKQINLREAISKNLVHPVELCLIKK